LDENSVKGPNGRSILRKFIIGTVEGGVVSAGRGRGDTKVGETREWLDSRVKDRRHHSLKSAYWKTLG